MASKISGQTMYLPIVPYKVDGSSGEEFNELSVTVNFDSHRKHFYVAIHAGWKSSWGGHGCIIMGGDDPLTAPKYVKVKDSPKNSQNTIDEMFARLEQAKEDIARLFDQRDWTRLYAAVRNIALYGYTEQFRSQMKALIEKTNNIQTSSNNKEDQTMKLNLSNNNNESGNAAKQQVNNNASEPIVKQVDVMGLMGALSRDGHAKLSDHVIEDAEAEEVKDEQAEEIESVNVGEVTLATIMPKMQSPTPTLPEGEGVTKQEVAQAIVKAATTGEATTKPLGKHGTLVIASGGGDKPKPKKPAKTTEPDPEAVGELAGMLTKVTLVTYTTKRGETAPRIIGFGGEDDPRWKPIHDEKQALIAAYNKAKKKDPKTKMTSSPFGPAWLSDREGNGEKTYCMTFGVKYMEVAKALCAAYNTADRDQWAKAEQAVRDQKAGIAAGYQAEREAKRAARAARNENGKPAEQPAAPAMSNEEQAMFELFKKFMQGDKEAIAQVNEVLKAA